MISKQGNEQFKSTSVRRSFEKRIENYKCKKKKKNMIKYQRCNIFFFHVILTLIKISPSKDHYPLHHFLRYNLLHFSSFSFSSLINPYFTPFPGYNNESNLYSIVHS